MLHCIKQQLGIVLLTVLLFMQIIVFLGLYAMQTSLILHKISQQDESNLTIKNAVETILHQVETDVLINMPLCQIPITSADELMVKSFAWWQSSVTCSGNFSSLQYYYVVEFLSEDPCALSKQSVLDSFEEVSSAYYRITLFVITNNRLGIKVQSTVIKTVNSQQTCKGLFHAVVVGRQQWHELQ